MKSDKGSGLGRGGHGKGHPFLEGLYVGFNRAKISQMI